MRFVCLVLVFSAALTGQKDLAGSARIRVSLEKLQTLGRVLHIAAHPDDENTALLALSARGWKYRTAYLSLTRGEGGQNLIGSEQGELMGVIRTQELLAARRIDGAEQLFTRAIDFGFSKTADETLTKWDRDKVLSDVVYHIRRFQPDVIVLRFSGTPRDGHGQHQASALLGKEAFEAAADGSKFPGLPPWRAKRLVLNVASFSPAMEKEAEALPAKITLDLGKYDPVLGYSYGEIAGTSRSQHRSQAMGWREDKGAQRNFFVVIGGDGAAKDLFDGIDTSWKRVAGSAPVAAALAKALREYDGTDAARIVPLLISARQELVKLSDRWVSDKLVELDELIAHCVGLFLDAGAPKYHVGAGRVVELRLSAMNRSAVPVTLESVAVEGDSVTSGKSLTAGVGVTELLTVKMPSIPTQPYWLARPRGEAMYDIPIQPALDNPDGPTALTAAFVLNLGGERITLVRPVVHRYVDRIYGELTRPLISVPDVVVRFSERGLLFPSRAARRVTVQVTAMEPNAKGTVRLGLPSGWVASPATQPFDLPSAGEQTTVPFMVAPPAGAATAVVTAVAEAGGKTYSTSMTSIEYPHITRQAVFAPAEATFVRADVQVSARRIGYVMGSGDDVPKALEQLGCEVILLSKDDLAQASTAKFDAIVTGVRAFNTRPDLRANAKQLFEYVAAGGRLIVQYNVMEGGFFGGNPKLLESIGPYPISINQGRVTEEDAQVEFNAAHPLLLAPNRIGKPDFDGWVQERGLYFAAKWDPKYETLFSMHDKGETGLKGGTLVARHGKGTYIFTPLSWFRQLPAGVPGAYRVFANFLSAQQ